jgi:hypothetical protein
VPPSPPEEASHPAEEIQDALPDNTGDDCDIHPEESRGSGNGGQLPQSRRRKITGGARKLALTELLENAKNLHCGLHDMLKRTRRESADSLEGVVLDHLGTERDPPPLTANCLASLGTSIGENQAWKDTISWTHTPETTSMWESRCENELHSKTTVSLDAKTMKGLARMADRLGYVFGGRAKTKACQPNVPGLLRALGSGEAFQPGSVLSRSLESGEHAARSVSKVISLLEQLQSMIPELEKLAPCESKKFHEVYRKIVTHKDNKSKVSWPLLEDPGPPYPALPVHVPTDILNVWPEDLQNRVATKVRRQQNARVHTFVCNLARSYGFESPDHHDGVAALACQLTGGRRSNLIDFSTQQTAADLLVVPDLRNALKEAVLQNRQTRRSMFQQLYPERKAEMMMMSSASVSYRARDGFKSVCPFGSWHGRDQAVATKHEVFEEIANTLMIGPTRDGWVASLRAVLELETEAVASQNGFGEDFFTRHSAGLPESFLPAEDQEGSASSPLLFHCGVVRNGLIGCVLICQKQKIPLPSLSQSTSRSSSTGAYVLQKHLRLKPVLDWS